jgi:N-acetyl-gamma-glutamyl-phosphate reductase
MRSVGVIGASGYAGAELLRLAAGHPELEVTLATGDTQAGRPVAELYPSLAAAYGDLAFSSYEPSLVDGLDLCFLALPHGASQALVAEIRAQVKWVVDLAADFRLHDPDLYPQWYGEVHTAPELLGDLAFGLPELFREQIAASTAVAAPGCYPTAATLPLAPLVAAGLIDGHGIIVDAASGVSGAGRPSKDSTTFCTVDEDFTAYSLLTHRHTPEIEQAVAEAAGLVAGSDVQVLFTPHLAPMNRGILATCYARPTGSTSTAELLDCYREAYGTEPFVVTTEGSPSTKATLGSNAAHLTARYDERTGYVIAICALDNLVKGASGQALQCANILMGIDETTGLSAVGVYP